MSYFMTTPLYKLKKLNLATLQLEAEAKRISIAGKKKVDLLIALLVCDFGCEYHTIITDWVCNSYANHYLSLEEFVFGKEEASSTVDFMNTPLNQLRKFKLSELQRESHIRNIKSHGKKKDTLLADLLANEFTKIQSTEAAALTTSKTIAQWVWRYSQKLDDGSKCVADYIFE